MVIGELADVDVIIFGTYSVGYDGMNIYSMIFDSHTGETIDLKNLRGGDIETLLLPELGDYYSQKLKELEKELISELIT